MAVGQESEFRRPWAARSAIASPPPSENLLRVRPGAMETIHGRIDQLVADRQRKTTPRLRLGWRVPLG